MLYNCIVQSGTVREKLPLVQSLSVVGGWGGMPKLYISQVAPCISTWAFFQIFPELTKQKKLFSSKNKKNRCFFKKRL